MAQDCYRCAGKKKPAVATRRLRVDDESYEVELCEEHDRAFSRDIGAWTRLMRESGPVVREGLLSITRERSIERAAQDLHRRSQFRVDPPADPKVVVVQKLPAKVHTWQLSPHALERCLERDVVPQDALIAAADPAIAFRDRKTGYWIHRRGDINTVVNRNTHTVITVVTNAMLYKEHPEIREVVGG